MSINQAEFLNKISELFDETPKFQIDFNSKFKEFDDWSSLVSLSLIVFFDDNYNFKINPEMIKSAETIQDLYNLIG